MRRKKVGKEARKQERFLSWLPYRPLETMLCIFVIILHEFRPCTELENGFQSFLMLLTSIGGEDPCTGNLRT